MILVGEAQLVDKENTKVKKKANEIFEKEIGDESSKNDDDEVSNDENNDN